MKMKIQIQPPSFSCPVHLEIGIVLIDKLLEKRSFRPMTLEMMAAKQRVSATLPD